MLPYPKTRRDPTSYTRHARTIPEPYLYLEDPNGEDTKAFVAAQNKLFKEVMSAYPHKEKITEEMTKAQDNPRTSTVFPYNGQFYFYHNTGLQNQSVLYRMPAVDSPQETASVFLDPNELSKEGTSALGSTEWSHSQTLFAYVVKDAGSDWGYIRVRDGVTGKDLDDKVEWVKFSGISWYGDEGFLYTRYPESEAAAKDKGTETEANVNAMICYHKVGTPQSDDVQVLCIPEHPKWLIGAEISDCQKYLIVNVRDGCEPKNLVWYSALEEQGITSSLAFVKLVDEWKAEYDFLGNNGAEFFFSTTDKAPMRKIVSLNVETKEEQELIPERESVLEYSLLVRDSLILVYLEHVKHVTYIYTLSNLADAPVKLDLPIGSLAGLSYHRRCDFVCLKMTSFLLPGRSFYFDINSPEKLTVFRDDPLAGFKPDDFETQQVFYESTGGAKIPMFIMYRKGVSLNGKNPTMLYGYGGFNISMTPEFSPSRVVFLKNMGGVIAVASIRGGGEYGEAWHNAARKELKMTCFEDFKNGAVWLQDNNWCSPGTLSIMGGSNGGLLVGACMLLWPQLFKAVICQVGVLDMLKFHQFTIGHAWISDYGDPDDAQGLDVVLKYSPLHNIRTNTHYPAILCLTGDHDDRVVPLHTLKFVASLQHANPEIGGPFLARVEVDAGHGAGTPTSKRIEQAADIYAFLGWQLNCDWKEE